MSTSRSRWQRLLLFSMRAMILAIVIVTVYAEDDASNPLASPEALLASPLISPAQKALFQELREQSEQLEGTEAGLEKEAHQRT